MWTVTADQLWRAVGELLLLQRSKRKWNPIDVERAGGPTYKTVQAIEQGEVGNVDKLALHAEALGLSLVDVLRAVLDRSGVVNPEIEQLVRTYQQTTVDGRQAMLALARALPVSGPAVGEENASPRRSPPALRVKASRTR